MRIFNSVNMGTGEKEKFPFSYKIDLPDDSQLLTPYHSPTYLPLSRVKQPLEYIKI